MQRIVHRVNTRQHLREIPTQYGVEIDIRSQGEALILHHDPFQPGEPLSSWLPHFKHKTLILNVKEEGLEKRLLALMESYGIDDFFFLDQTFPFLIKTVNAGEPRCAVRLSEHEPPQIALSLKGLAKWIWVDCFTRLPLDGTVAHTLQQAGYRLCLVSPELLGNDPEIAIPQMHKQLLDQKIVMDAVCTKRPDLWDE
ncbi:hypothetical protein [Magnetococcus sp. PR-3]|uniref:hypothetical protein n=1 Tax=Magnetococcus sp. PR-3 TaxID=3120355 RepID=UPI002FCE3F5B